MLRTTLTAAVAVLALTASANAQVKLRWKINENSTTTTTVTSKLHQILTINEQEIETKNEESVVVKTTTGKRKKNGTIQQIAKNVSLKANITLPGGVKLVYDSAKPVEPQGTAADFLLEVFAAIPKLVSTTVYDKDNRVVSIEVDQKPLKDLADNAKAVLKGRFDSDYLKTAANKQLDRIPTKAIKKGDTWSKTLTARLGAAQTLTFTTTYKYEGTVKKDGKTLDKISYVTTDVKYAQGETESPVKVTSSKLKVASSKGTLLFDRKLGTIVSDSDKLRVKGTLTLDANGKELAATLDLTIEKAVTVK